jgi:hypothetical protein
MKKSFTLLELLISITIFMIMIVFLYKTIDQTKYTNNVFSKKQDNLKETNHLHNIFLEDISESSTVFISTDKNKNSIIKIVTNNTFHNPNFNNVTYLVGETNKFIRIESLEVFNENDLINVGFFENAYIDVLLENIEFFEAKGDGVNFNIFIKEKDKKREFFNAYKMSLKGT